MDRRPVQPKDPVIKEILNILINYLKTRGSKISLNLEFEMVEFANEILEDERYFFIEGCLEDRKRYAPLSKYKMLIVEALESNSKPLSEAGYQRLREFVGFQRQK